MGPLLYPLCLSQGKKAQAGVAFHLGSGVRGAGDAVWHPEALTLSRNWGSGRPEFLPWAPQPAHRGGWWFTPLSLRGLSCPGSGRVRGLRRPLLRLCVQWEALSAQSWVLAENQPRVRGGGREAHLESAGTIVKITHLVNMYRAPPVCKALSRLASALREPVQWGRQFSSSYHKNK